MQIYQSGEVYIFIYKQNIFHIIHNFKVYILLIYFIVNFMIYHLIFKIFTISIHHLNFINYFKLYYSKIIFINYIYTNVVSFFLNIIFYDFYIFINILNTM